uniref:Uncharacterized protein n=1 Tax=Globisporangium ultimum (strain ATCC 200006 / CBS 805.95 / DAOM BR144) TaxID=431595 RepID=K3WPB6_GLOUD
MAHDEIQTAHMMAPLTTARVVCQAHLGVSALSHAVSLVSAFMDYATPRFWSIPRACGRTTTTTDLRLLERLRAHEPPDMDRYHRMHLFSEALVSAVRADNLEVMTWLCTVYCREGLTGNAMREAARSGNVRMLEWLAQNCQDTLLWSFRFMDEAALGGHLDAVVWLDGHPQNPGCSPYVLTNAARNGHIRVVEWLQTHKPEVESSFPLDTAVTCGQLHVAQYLHEHGHHQPNLEISMNFVALKGNLELLEWLHMQSDAEFSQSVLDHAAAGGHLRIIQWLHTHRSEGCTSHAMDHAATAGHLDIVQWLHENRHEGCTTQAMDGAAENGHLEVVQWLHAHRNESCTTRALDLAALNGHLEVLKWLHANRNEEWSVSVMNNAATGGHLHIVEWLHGIQTPGREGATTDAMDGAAGNGHLDVVKWLHDHRDEGCTQVAMDMAATNGHLEIVKWLHANRSEGCTRDAMDGAARNNLIDVVQWLHANRVEGCSTRAMDQAGSLEMLEWLHNNRDEGCTANAMSTYHDDFQRLVFLYSHFRYGCSESVVKWHAFHNRVEVCLWISEHYPEHRNYLLENFPEIAGAMQLIRRHNTDGPQRE